MPPINEYRCNKCGLSFPSGWGGYMHVEVDKELLEKRYREISARLEELERLKMLLQKRREELERLVNEFREKILNFLKSVESEFKDQEIEIKRHVLELKDSMVLVNEFMHRFIKEFSGRWDKLVKGILEEVSEFEEKLVEDRQFIMRLMEKLKETNKDTLRVTCPHPAEHETVARILGEKAPKDLVKSRIGFNSYCICLDCLHQFEADLRDEKVNEWCFWYGFPSYKEAFRSPKPPEMKDERKCPKCGSKNVKTVFELLWKLCPKCKEGTIVETETGIIS